MNSGRAKDLVALGALVSAALFGGWLFVRERYQLGTRWTDGRSDFDSPVDDRIRHAIWDRPRPLPFHEAAGDEHDG